jgi:hypothetical protein
VLEAPDNMLGDGPIGVWASISRRSNGVLEQMDRGGNPTINPFINPDGEKNLFNSRQPADDVANYLEPWTVILQNAGGYIPALRPQAPRRPACPLPLPRPAQPQPLRRLLCVGDVTDSVVGTEVHRTPPGSSTRPAVDVTDVAFS